MAAFKPWAAGMSEAQLRQWLAYLFEQTSIGKAKTGVVAGLAVSATSPSASGSVVVGAGAGVVQPSTGGGAFPLVEPSDETVDVFTANPMQFVNNPRNDVVVLDQTTGLVQVLTGAPNAVPSDPAIPATALPLARLRHAANATTIPAGNIDDLRTYVGPFANSTPWIDLPKPGGVTGTLKYRLRGNMVDVAVDVTGTFATGFTAVSTTGALPAAARPTITPPRSVAYVGSGTTMGSVEVLTTGTINVQCSSASTVAKASFTYPAG